MQACPWCAPWSSLPAHLVRHAYPYRQGTGPPVQGSSLQGFRYPRGGMGAHSLRAMHAPICPVCTPWRTASAQKRPAGPCFDPLANPLVWALKGPESHVERLTPRRRIGDTVAAVLGRYARSGLQACRRARCTHTGARAYSTHRGIGTGFCLSVSLPIDTTRLQGKRPYCRAHGRRSGSEAAGARDT